MVRNVNDISATVLTEMFGGKGSFTQHHILQKDEMQGHGRLFADCSLEVGGCVANHTHHGDHEICYFLSGKGKVTDDGRETEVGPGDVNFCPDGHSHQIENIGDTELRYIAVILYK